MKTKLFLLSLFIGTHLTLGQGPLSPPPGLPAPSMKSLDQIEPRTPVGPATTPGNDTALLRITQPGSYYFTGNIAGVTGKNGIEVVTSGVTLDLNGFELQGVPGSLAGILINTAQKNIVVRNGSLRSWGQSGINSVLAVNLKLEGLVSAENGGVGINAGANGNIVDCRAHANGGVGIQANSNAVISRCGSTNNGGRGFNVGNSSTVTACVAVGNGDAGFGGNIQSVFNDCAARDNNGDGFVVSGATLTNCFARDNTGSGFDISTGSTATTCTAANNSGSGFVFHNGCVIRGCSSFFNSSHGFHAQASARITDCNASYNHGSGIIVPSNCSVINNTCSNNTLELLGVAVGAGITVSGKANRIDGNDVVSNDYGIRVSDDNNIIVRNTARGNTSGNYSIGAGNESAQVLTNPGTDFVATNPWANFAY